MKRKIILFAAFAALVLAFACNEEEKDPVLTGMTAQEVITPEEGGSYVITKEILDSSLVISWSAAAYSIALSNPTYVVQFDSASGTFAKPKSSTTTDTFSVMKYSALNKILLDWGKDTALPFSVKIRILSSISGQLEQVSEVVSFDITPYIEPEVIDTTDTIPAFEADTIYLVGSATAALWDNTKGLPIVCTTADSVYTITTELTTGGMKVLKYLGKWAPQWGDDGSLSGLLKFRPDEATTDPPEIPSPGEGTFKIDVDIINLTYTITPI